MHGPRCVLGGTSLTGGRGRVFGYEGYPSFYYKTEMTLDVKGIRTGKLRRRRAFVYIMREERPYGVPASSYLSICGQGYRFFGFPVDKLLEAHCYSRERMKSNERR